MSKTPNAEGSNSRFEPPKEPTLPFWHHCVTLHCDHPTNPRYRKRKPFNIAWFTPFRLTEHKQPLAPWDGVWEGCTFNQGNNSNVPRSPSRPDVHWEPVSRMRQASKRALIRHGESFDLVHFYVPGLLEVATSSHMVDVGSRPRRSRFGLSVVLEFTYKGSKIDPTDEAQYRGAENLMQYGWDGPPLVERDEADSRCLALADLTPRPPLGVGAALKGRYVWPKCPCGKRWPPLDWDLTQAALTRLRAANFNWPDRWGSTEQKPAQARDLNISMATFAKITRALLADH